MRIKYHMKPGTVTNITITVEAYLKVKCKKHYFAKTFWKNVWFTQPNSHLSKAHSWF